jgi:hypothetical protein
MTMKKIYRFLFIKKQTYNRPSIILTY